VISRLHITVSFDQSVSHYLTKYLEIDSQLAEELEIRPGTHKAGVLWETENQVKVNYRGAVIWLDKSKIKVVSVEEKGLFDF
jgi:hypothetical protein